MHDLSPPKRDKGCLAWWKRVEAESFCVIIGRKGSVVAVSDADKHCWVGVLCGWHKDLWGYISYTSSSNALWEEADWEAELPGWLKLSTAGVRLGKLDNWSCSLKHSKWWLSSFSLTSKAEWIKGDSQCDRGLTLTTLIEVKCYQALNVGRDLWFFLLDFLQVQQLGPDLPDIWFVTLV